ncbi:baculoviral IAP repeat-containing protein 3-like isoform X2 [Biomphalaria glabrata]|nr:baculoviral IAP repeat-containing protein 3-like isoform X2 [Biomphalaria glabrata]
MESELKRLSTFLQYPSDSVKSACFLANNGYFYIGDGTNDEVQCFFCNQSKSNWKSDEDIIETHSSVSPKCPMVTREKSDNRPMQDANPLYCGETYREYNPKYYKIYSKNLRDIVLKEADNNFLNVTGKTYLEKYYIFKENLKKINKVETCPEETSTETEVSTFHRHLCTIKTTSTRKDVVLSDEKITVQSLNLYTYNTGLNPTATLLSSTSCIKICKDFYNLLINLKTNVSKLNGTPTVFTDVSLNEPVANLESSTDVTAPTTSLDDKINKNIANLISSSDANLKEDVATPMSPSDVCLNNNVTNLTSTEDVTLNEPIGNLTSSADVFLNEPVSNLTLSAVVRINEPLETLTFSADVCLHGDVSTPTASLHDKINK